MHETVEFIKMAVEIAESEESDDPTGEEKEKFLRTIFNVSNTLSMLEESGLVEYFENRFKKNRLDIPEDLLLGFIVGAYATEKGYISNGLIRKFDEYREKVK